VYPRPDGTIYICGIGGSDYISTEDLKSGAFLEECNAQDARVEAAKNSFQRMSSIYRVDGELERVQACMRPCPPGMAMDDICKVQFSFPLLLYTCTFSFFRLSILDAKPYMGPIPGYEGAFINAGHNCWGTS
jgi:hypothetical protein